MAILHIQSNSPKRTQEIGSIIGKLTKPNDLILLSGILGSGKTCLTQGIARGLDINEYTLSPTFVLVREYYGRLQLYHIDLYRLDSSDDMMSIGLDDYIYGNGVCVIEWAEKGANILPASNLSIQFSYLSHHERDIQIEAHGERYEQLLKTAAESL
ncbi:MAG TPA: tRNA (adenosine(37)-N6)-threonylcarbamoyltransferase complex ATPase subunit type 1 TsaE [Dehalococcoidia bacterium]|nr:tRNA (adenosine(37)-N6)-threonylcarbamoyltransferase complex ATPase subunit type 1 TsaE [Dehalococcoidia bacterium]